MSTKHLEVGTINGAHVFPSIYGEYIDGEHIYYPVVEYDWYGWNCCITDDFVICDATREYSDGVHSITLTIALTGKGKGRYKVVWSFINDQTYGGIVLNATCEKRSKLLKKGWVNVDQPFEIILGSGHVDDRFATVRDCRFIEFLERHNLTGVFHQDPNRVYDGMSIYCGGGNAHHHIYTDGVCEEILTDLRSDPSGWQDNLYLDRSEIKVQGATIAVLDTAIDYRDSHSHGRVLYTLRNIYEIEDLIDEVYPHRRE